jgi:N utilization substance protein B
MLNRRTLRIKIMQSLFAFEQCKEANYLLSFDFLDEFFKPDLNSMKVQDKELLKGQRDVAVVLFEKRFRGEPASEHADPRIARSVEDALALHEKNTKKDLAYFRKHILLDVEKISRWYYAVLNLVPAFASVAAQDKRQATANFRSNPYVVALRDHAELRRESLRNGGGWDEDMTRVRDWWRECIKADKTFHEYLEAARPSADDHAQIIKYLIRKLILGKTAINAWFEEQDLWWTEDHEIIRSMTDKTLKSFGTDGAIELQKLSLNWDDDKDFVERLFEGAALLDDSYRALIASHTKNWEVDRLPLTDRVILHMALSEMTLFPSIPVKVTINEYIELAKEYSTPKSRQFINGILDVMAKELTGTGKIKKSGRGLIDNK